jgi:DNA mismatch endonuclease, patch repair protein
MSHIRGKDTSPEQIIRSVLHKRGYRFRKHVKSLPGSPDIVFGARGVAVFVDGDFWHGYRFPTWRHRLGAFWQLKIDRNIGRDRRNFARLRRAGWIVLRLWEHQVRADREACADRVVRALQWSPNQDDSAHDA